jgi:gamma-glutamylcyclotransferase (GGCT)/AIG2-like uncharacterized protein YtfP
MKPLFGLDRAATRADRFRLNYPVAVFGTLRRGQANVALMAGFTSWRRGFLPHFVAQGYRLWHRRGSSAPFEVYTFADADWPAVMTRVDALEEFTPETEAGGDYHRTLMEVALLPEGFAHPLLDAPGWITPESPERDLSIPEGEWGKMERIACWVYSSPGENARSVEHVDSPVIWW